MKQTADTDLTLNDLTRSHPVLIPFFANKGVDFFCGGDRSVKAVCAEKNWDLTQFMDEVAACLDKTGEGPVPIWQTGSEADLIGYILKRFHQGHRRDFQVLGTMMERVVKTHAKKWPLVHDLAKLVQELTDDIEPHMVKEERVLFPMILRRLGIPTHGGNPCVNRPDGPIHVMRMEHENMGHLLESLAGITNQFTPPEWAGPSLSGIFATLEWLNREIRLHVHLENNVLFPMVQALDWDD